MLTLGQHKSGARNYRLTDLLILWWYAGILSAIISYIAISKSKTEMGETLCNHVANVDAAKFVQQRALWNSQTLNVWDAA